MEIDRVMTINNGMVAEFDSLDNLEKNKKSLFNELQINFTDEENYEKEDIKEENKKEN